MRQHKDLSQEPENTRWPEEKPHSWRDPTARTPRMPKGQISSYKNVTHTPQKRSPLLHCGRNSAVLVTGTAKKTGNMGLRTLWAGALMNGEMR